jgi:hypothetical protein
MKTVFVALSLCVLSASAGAAPLTSPSTSGAKIEAFDFVAPIVKDDTVPPKQAGSIFFNAAAGNFQGFDLSGATMTFGNANSAQWVGSIKWPSTTDCNWQRISHQNWGDFSADSDCSNPTVSGKLSAPGTKIPALTVTVDDAYVYKIEARGAFYVGTTPSCVARFSDGTQISNPMEFGGSGNDNSWPVLTAEFAPSSSGAKTYSLQMTGASASVDSNCAILNDGATIRELEISVYRYPRQP